jgi:hypothetical protein
MDELHSLTIGSDLMTIAKALAGARDLVQIGPASADPGINVVIGLPPSGYNPLVHVLATSGGAIISGGITSVQSVRTPLLVVKEVRTFE